MQGLNGNLRYAPDYTPVLSIIYSMTSDNLILWDASAETPGASPKTKPAGEKPCMPNPGMFERRKQIEKKISDEMSDCLFTLKCRIYKSELENIINEYRQTPNRPFLNLLNNVPILTLNSAERKLFEKISAVDWNSILSYHEPYITCEDTRYLLNEILTSLTNRVMNFYFIKNVIHRFYFS